MIEYRRGAFNIIFRVLQVKGSVFPCAALVAFPGAAASFLLKWAMEEGFFPGLTRFQERSVLRETAVWSSFTFLVGFLIVFRTSQAYNRFWDGCTSTHQMRAEWFDACSSLIAFCRHTSSSRSEVVKFEHILVRLFSMLHAVALAEIEDSSSDDVHQIAAFKYELVDAASIDKESLKYIKDCDARVELLYQWIQQLVVDHVTSGIISIPPPLLSRTFQELANGMCQFHEAIKISTIPFPFPYAQTCDCLLFLSFIMTPLVVTQFVNDPWWAAFFSFVQIFIHWTLNLTAVEIENPFGYDPNDIDAEAMQLELNRHLMLLISPRTQQLPTLAADWEPSHLGAPGRSCSLSEVWAAIGREEEHRARRSLRSKRWAKSQDFVCFDDSLNRSEPEDDTDTHPNAWQLFGGWQSERQHQEDEHHERPAGHQGKQESDGSGGGRGGASMTAVAVVAAEMESAKSTVNDSDVRIGQVRFSDQAYYHHQYAASEREYDTPDYRDMEGMRSGDMIRRARAAEDAAPGPRSRWAMPWRKQPPKSGGGGGGPAPAEIDGGPEGEGRAPPDGVDEGGGSPRGGTQRPAALRVQEPRPPPPAVAREGAAAPVSTL